MSDLRELPLSLREYLDHQHARYELIPHLREMGAQRTAAVTHTPGGRFAKCVMVKLDGTPAMVVLPADHRLDLGMLRKAVGASDATMVSEAEMQARFPDCEVGAEPPFGRLYDLPVYVSSALANQETITFNGGTHEEAIRMPYAEFERITEPKTIECSIKTSAGWLM